jgi:hypothetical protein
MTAPENPGRVYTDPTWADPGRKIAPGPRRPDGWTERQWRAHLLSEALRGWHHRPDESGHTAIDAGRTLADAAAGLLGDLEGTGEAHP